MEHWKKTSKIWLNQFIHGVDIDYDKERPAEDSNRRAVGKKSFKTSHKMKKRQTLYDYMMKYPVFEENRAYDLVSIHVHIFLLIPNCCIFIAKVSVL